MGMLRALKVGLWLIRYIPAPILRVLLIFVGVTFYLLAGSRRRMIITNQRQILGAVSPLRLHWHALQVMINLFRTYYSLAQLLHLPEQTIYQQVELHGEEHLKAALDAGKGIIILGAHIANYNILASFTALYHDPAGTFVENVEPPELFAFVNKVRARTGLQLFLPDRAGVVGAMQLLKHNGVLIIAGDRYLGTNGTLVRFFGKPTYLSHGPVILAQRSGAPLVPASLERLRDGRLRVTLRDPLPLIDTHSRREDLAANMRLVAEALEMTIRPLPEQWLMVAPAWSTNPAGQDAIAAAVEKEEQPQVIRRRIGWFTGAGVVSLLSWRWWRAK